MQDISGVSQEFAMIIGFSWPNLRFNVHLVIIALASMALHLMSMHVS